MRGAEALRALALLDLTDLNDTSNDDAVRELCARAVMTRGHVAAVCIWPRFVSLARAALTATPVAVATVINFPAGTDRLEEVLAATTQALAAGADEIDLVMPWRALRAGEVQPAATMIAAVKALTGTRPLKVILETGELQDPTLVRTASLLAIDQGADFIKTSTGKTSVSATPEAARIMLQAIFERGGHVGFKAAGGLRTLEQAQGYIDLADGIFGRDWTTPAHMRLGASGLLGVLLAEIKGAKAAAGEGY
ncbi:MAG: deoxyribose-phosphate aldolase [Hyphomicrobiales bacterium]|nr:deoxyribose-phosphate aldolase [Hyphomicrobiales bacterium]